MHHNPNLHLFGFACATSGQHGPLSSSGFATKIATFRTMKKIFIVVATATITIAFWMLIVKAVTGCYTAICGK